MVCLGFDVMPDEIGFPPESGLGGKGFSEAQAAIGKRKSLIPLQRWTKTEILDHIIATQFGRPDLQWRWRDLDHDDSQEQETIDKQQLETARRTLNEWRIENDLEPYDFKEADEPFFVTSSGPVFVRDFLKRQVEQDKLASDQAQTDMQVAKKPPVDPNKKPAPSAAKAADLARWRRKATRAKKEGKSALVAFASDHIPAEEMAEIHARLEKAATPADVAAAFPREREENHHPAWLTELGDEIASFHEEFAAKARDEAAAPAD
jgi:hypothetical protein